MDAFSSLMSGFSAALTPTYIAMCFLGVLLGQIVGVLPGIGPAAAIALLAAASGASAQPNNSQAYVYPKTNTANGCLTQL